MEQIELMKQDSKENRERHILTLCNLIRKRCAQQIRTPRDFHMLSILILDQTHSYVSVSTLKRVMGYLPNNNVKARATTLDILSRFVNYRNFDEFCLYHREETSHGRATDIQVLKEVRDVRHQLERLTEQCRIMEKKMEGTN